MPLSTTPLRPSSTAAPADGHYHQSIVVLVIGTMPPPSQAPPPVLSLATHGSWAAPAALARANKTPTMMNRPAITFTPTTTKTTTTTTAARQAGASEKAPEERTIAVSTATAAATAAAGRAAELVQSAESRKRRGRLLLTGYPRRRFRRHLCSE